MNKYDENKLISLAKEFEPPPGLLRDANESLDYVMRVMKGRALVRLDGIVKEKTQEFAREKSLIDGYINDAKWLFSDKPQTLFFNNSGYRIDIVPIRQTNEGEREYLLRINNKYNDYYEQQEYELFRESAIEQFKRELGYILEESEFQYDRLNDTFMSMKEEAIRESKEITLPSGRFLERNTLILHPKLLQAVSFDYLLDEAKKFFMMGRVLFKIPLNVDDWKYAQEGMQEKLKEYYNTIYKKEEDGTAEPALFIDFTTDMGTDKNLGEFYPYQFYLKVFLDKKYNLDEIFISNLEDRVRNTLRHEIQHMSQELIRAYTVDSPHEDKGKRDVDWGGPPKSSIRERNVDFHGSRVPRNIGDERIPHQIRPVEFKTRLSDDIQQIRKNISNFNVPAKYIKKYLKYFVGLSQHITPKELSEKIANYEYSRYGRFDANTMHKGKKWEEEPYSQSSWLKYLLANGHMKIWRQAVSEMIDVISSEMDIQDPEDLGIYKTVEIPDIFADSIFGQSIVQFLSRPQDDYKDLSEYERLVLYKELTEEMPMGVLIRHKKEVNKTGDKEYWVTPRWMDVLERANPEEDKLPKVERDYGTRVPDHPNMPSKFHYTEDVIY